MQGVAFLLLDAELVVREQVRQAVRAESLANLCEGQTLRVRARKAVIEIACDEEERRVVDLVLLPCTRRFEGQTRHDGRPVCVAPGRIVVVRGEVTREEGEARACWVAQRESDTDGACRKREQCGTSARLRAIGIAERGLPLLDIHSGPQGMYAVRTSLIWERSDCRA